MTTHQTVRSVAGKIRPRTFAKLGVVLILGFAMSLLMLGLGTEEAPAQNSYDQHIIDLTNAHRASIGRAPFAVSASLSSDSRAWSQTMMESGFRHASNLGTTGENIAMSRGPAGIKVGVSWSTSAGPLPSYCRSSMDYTTAEFMVCQWLSSSGHRAAIESSAYKQIGVGTASGPDSFGRQTFSTQRFSTVTPTPIASFTSPGSGSRLCSGDDISWSGPNSGKYRLRIGTNNDGTQVMNESTNGKSMQAAPLPSDRTLYASLRYQPSGGSWQLVAQRTFSPCANPVELTTTNTLCSGDEITWSGPNSGRYKVRVGTRFDGTQQMNQGTSSRSIDIIPGLVSGQTLFLSLRHRGSDGVWRLKDTHVYLPCAKPIEFVSPNGNARLCDNDLIDWIGRSSGRYRIRIGTSADGTQVRNESVLATKFNVGNLSSNLTGNLFVYLRHQTVDGGPWALHDTLVLRAC